MTDAKSVWRLLTYDVRDPRRLRRLHYRLQRESVFLQESVALLRLDEAELDELLEELSPLLSPCDDLRVYHLASLQEIWTVGPNPIAGPVAGEGGVILLGGKWGRR